MKTTLTIAAARCAAAATGIVQAARRVVPMLRGGLAGEWLPVAHRRARPPKEPSADILSRYQNAFD